jgi:trimeric autotransporter adhesin
VIRSILAAALLLVATPSLAVTFTVTNTNSSGAGSLTKAITDANLTEAADIIEFNILSLGVATINGPLPTITEPLTIDGYTQGSATPNTASTGTNAVIRIQLDATHVPSGQALLEIDGPSTVIKGVAIRGIASNNFGIRITTSPGVTIRGCFIGVHANGTTDGSAGTGIRIEGDVAFIGGGDLEDRNLISGNDTAGIDVRGSVINIHGNVIGTDRTGAAPLPNGTGIRVTTSEAAIVTIGSAGPYAGNDISLNQGDGIEVTSTAAGPVEIHHNRFYQNGGLAIDLNADGVTPNDASDADDGPNDLQNYPVLTFARLNGDTLTVEGYLDAPEDIYRLDFYFVDLPDPSRHGEGETYIANVELDSPGGTFFFREKIELDFPVTLPIDVTATAESIGSEATSEFSRVMEVISGGTEIAVTNTNDSGAGSLRAALLAANANAAANTVIFQLPLPLQPIRPLTTLSIGEQLIVDGYTQAGATVNTYSSGTNAQLKVEIDGSMIPNGTPLLQVNAPDVVLRGLAVNSSPNVGILFGGTEGGRVEGNFLGTDLTGTVDKGNGSHGVWAAPGMTDIEIGGDQHHQRNLISGNRTGIYLQGSFGMVRGNLIGTSPSPASPLPNSDHGIDIAGEYVDIGGDKFGDPAANVIRFNEDTGIRVGTTARHVHIRGNLIESNGSLGIELAEDPFPAVTPNDADDADSGANELQNFPELTSVVALPGELQIEGTLDVPASDEDHLYVVRIHASESCDSSGHGEGVYLGQLGAPFSGDDEGFAFTLPFSISEGSAITATATDLLKGNTSEFSECVFVGVDVPLCGDASLDGEVKAGDALTVLKVAVGTADCELCVCDVNDSGQVTSSDALLALRLAVGQSVELDCPVCDAMDEAQVVLRVTDF